MAITTETLRNVALLGHGGSGKTSLTEAALYYTKASNRLGKPSEGNTVSDYDPEEIKRGFSLSTTVEPVLWKDKKINFLDTPGYFDFVGEVLQAVRVADSALILVDGKAGIEVGAELAWDYATDAGIPKSFFINKIDDPDAHFDKVFEGLRETFGVSVCPVIIPAGSYFLNLIDMKAMSYDKNGKRTESDIPAEFADTAEEYRAMLMESLAETSEELMEKFFAEEEITRDEAVEALHNGIIDGAIAPVFTGSALNLWCIDALLDNLADSYPKHTSKKVEKIETEDGVKDFEIKTEGDPSIFVFKTISDPFVGKMTFFKVMSGVLSNTMSLKNVRTGTVEKFAHMYTMKGKTQTEVDSLCCGDIGMIAKLSDTVTNDTLCLSAPVSFKKIVYPEPFMSMAVMPKAKGDEDKISTGINRILEEDNTLKYENDAETHQLVLSGLGDIHLDVVVSKLKTRYNTGVELEKPRIAYRETIKKTIDVQGKHKKQSGGHGQYGDVWIKFSPGEAEGLTFTESVVGGVVPKNFFPAVEKGLNEAMVKGVLAGYPMVHLAADLHDGSYHDVDSSEMAFKIAANLAYKQLTGANPVILEPVGELKTYVPDDMLGDVISDVNKRRGRVLGMSAYEGKKGYQVLEAEVPKSEMTDYTISLRAMSAGKGWFTFYFVRYEEVPAEISKKIIEAAAKEAEADK